MTSYGPRRHHDPDAEPTSYIPRQPPAPPQHPRRDSLWRLFWAGIALAIAVAAIGTVLGVIFVAAKVNGT